MELPLRRFLGRQYRDAGPFSAACALADIRAIGREPIQRYEVSLRTRGLVKSASGEVEVHEGCTFAVWFPDDYTRRVSPFETVQWIEPRNVWHPNFGPGPGGDIYICVGRIGPRTPLLDLVEQVHEIFGWVNRLPAENDALNHAACQWARAHGDRFPIDARPLRSAPAAIDLDGLELEEVPTP